MKPNDNRFRIERALRSGIGALLLALLVPAATATAQGGGDPTCTFVPVPGPFAMVEQWNWDSSATLPSHVQVMMTPVIANLTDDDGDGSVNENDVPDVIFSTFQGPNYASDSVVRAVNGDDGTLLFTTPLTSDLDVLGEGSIAVGDIDGDGLPEIIAVEDISETHSIDAFGRFIVFEHDGSFKFKSDLISDGRLRWGGAALADLNGDGTPEIVAGRHVLDNTGAILASGNSRKGDNAVGPLSTVADIDRDGSPDVVAGFTVYGVDVNGLNEITGLTVKWEAQSATGGSIAGDGFPGVGNFDLDEFGEVVVVSSSQVWLFDHDGSHIWGPQAIPGGGNGGAPNIDDFDNDGAVEVGTAGGNRYAVFDTDGSVLWSSPTFDNSSSLTGSSVFDFEGDGSAEVVYKDQTFLRVYRGTDGTVLTEVATGSGTTYENPVVADVDRDGNAEIVIASNNYAFGTRTGIQVFEDASDLWVNTRRIWNQHTYHITNVNDDATIPANESDNWLGFNNFRSQEAGTQDEVFAAPDLTVEFIDCAATPAASYATARVANGGDIVVGAGLPVSFYDGDPTSGGVLLGTAFTSGGIEPGDFEDVTLLLPAGFDFGIDLFAVADDAGGLVGTQNECDETNNANSVSGCVPSDLLSVEKSADPSELEEPGGFVTYSVAVTNIGPFALAIEEVVDDPFGDLSATCDPAVPGVLDPGESAVCETTEFVAGTPGDPHVNVATATATDGAGNTATASDDATVTFFVGNEPPDCGTAAAVPEELWPPNHKFQDIAIAGVVDPDGDPVAIHIDSIFQDEPLNGPGDGSTCPDGEGVGSDTASVRAERSGTKKVPGDGRVYHIGFSAEDGQGGACVGTVTVCVPHDQGNGDTCVDQGPLFDSTDGDC